MTTDETPGDDRTAEAPTFGGYPAATLPFLTELGSQDTSWFAENRSRYDELVVGPTKALVTALGHELQHRISSDLVAQPKANGSIAPINNDRRFAKDKSPYKDHLLLRFWEGADKNTAPTLFLRLSATDIGFAAGAGIGNLARWRTSIDAETSGAVLAAAIAELAGRHDLDVAGAELKNVPKPYSPDHPRSELLKHKGFQVRWTEPTPPEMATATFVDWCADRLDECAAIHRWLVEHLES